MRPVRRRCTMRRRCSATGGASTRPVSSAVSFFFFFFSRLAQLGVMVDGRDHTAHLTPGCGLRSQTATLLHSVFASHLKPLLVSFLAASSHLFSITSFPNFPSDFLSISCSLPSFFSPSYLSSLLHFTPLPPSQSSLFPSLIGCFLLLCFCSLTCFSRGLVVI